MGPESIKNRKGRRLPASEPTGNSGIISFLEQSPARGTLSPASSRDLCLLWLKHPSLFFPGGGQSRLAEGKGQAWEFQTPPYTNECFTGALEGGALQCFLGGRGGHTELLYPSRPEVHVAFIHHPSSRTKWKKKNRSSLPSREPAGWAGLQTKTEHESSSLKPRPGAFLVPGQRTGGGERVLTLIPTLLPS